MNGTVGSRQNWHNEVWVCGDNALGPHTTRPRRSLDKALRMRPGLSRQEVGARQGFSVAT